jgi:hypothetical protein
MLRDETGARKFKVSSASNNLHGVPPLGGGVRANTMAFKIFNADGKGGRSTG